MSDNLPHMDYRQHRRARRLVHECCNYDEGNCLLLDDGEPSYPRKPRVHRMSGELQNGKAFL